MTLGIWTRGNGTRVMKSGQGLERKGKGRLTTNGNGVAKKRGEGMGGESMEPDRKQKEG
jgi:hypothetical protein